MGEYMAANDRYMDIAIGNKTWPIGISMYGVHERTGKSRIIFSYILRKFIRPPKQSCAKGIHNGI